MVDNKIYDRIINVFKFDIDIVNRYEFLVSYSSKMTEWLRSNILNEEQLIRYMIVGFFIDYRGFNHRSENFSTIINEYTPNTIIEKCSLFNQVAPKVIKSTQEYLRLLCDNNSKSINDNKLFEFVINGNTIY